MPDSRDQAWLSVRPDGVDFSVTSDDSPGSLMADGEEASRASEDSGSTWLFVDDMPDIEVLLEQNRVAYSILERTTTRSLKRQERRIWMILLTVGLIWGVVTGLSLAMDGFFLHPATTVFGWLGLGVLGATTWTAAREHEADRGWP